MHPRCSAAEVIHNISWANQHFIFRLCRDYCRRRAAVALLGMAESRALRASTLFVLLSSGTGYSPFPSTKPATQPLHGHRQCTRCDVHDRTVVSYLFGPAVYEYSSPCCCIIKVPWYMKAAYTRTQRYQIPSNRRFSPYVVDLPP